MTSTPFSSTSKRESIFVDKEKEELPGPGSYIKETKMKKRRAASMNFKSKTSRFDPTGQALRTSQLPGPGSYETLSHDPIGRRPSSPNKEHSPSSSTSHVPMWTKVSSAPSIPSTSQSHGYEEGPTGELVSQKPPNNGYAGDHRDSIGPGGYYINDEYFQQRRDAGSVFKSATRREVFPTKATQPGPGQYDVERSEQMVLAQQPKSIRPENSVFLSSTRRDNTFSPPKEQTPGPGEYGYKSSFRVEKVPEKHQHFGSTTSRPFYASDASIKQNIPGPGYYVSSPPPAASLPTVRKPFASTSERFTGHRATPIPGPGSYDKDLKMASFTAEIESKAKIGSYGVFGSTSRRFKNEKSKAPGPGQYDYETPDKVTIIKKNDNRSSIFLSKTKRDPYKVPQEVINAPSVGQYEVKDEWIKRKGTTNAQSEVFLSSSPRFPSNEKEKKPGPGAYDHHDAYLANASQKSFLSSSQVLPKDVRFNYNSKTSTLPGPGSYEIDASLVKKSFNVTI